MRINQLNLADAYASSNLIEQSRTNPTHSIVRLTKVRLCLSQFVIDRCKFEWRRPMSVIPMRSMLKTVTDDFKRKTDWSMRELVSKQIKLSSHLFLLLFLLFFLMHASIPTDHRLSLDRIQHVNENRSFQSRGIFRRDRSGTCRTWTKTHSARSTSPIRCRKTVSQSWGTVSHLPTNPEERLSTWTVAKGGEVRSILSLW